MLQSQGQFLPQQTHGKTSVPILSCGNGDVPGCAKTSGSPLWDSFKGEGTALFSMALNKSPNLSATQMVSPKSKVQELKK